MLWLTGKRSSNFFPDTLSVAGIEICALSLNRFEMRSNVKGRILVKSLAFKASIRDRFTWEQLTRFTKLGDEKLIESVFQAQLDA